MSQAKEKTTAFNRQKLTFQKLFLELKTGSKFEKNSSCFLMTWKGSQMTSLLTPVLWYDFWSVSAFIRRLLHFSMRSIRKQKRLRNSTSKSLLMLFWASICQSFPRLKTREHYLRFLRKMRRVLLARSLLQKPWRKASCLKIIRSLLSITLIWDLIWFPSSSNRTEFLQRYFI